MRHIATLRHSSCRMLPPQQACTGQSSARHAGTAPAIAARSKLVATEPAGHFSDTFAKRELQKLLGCWAHRFLLLPFELARALPVRALEWHRFDKNGVMDVLECAFERARALDPALSYAAFVGKVVQEAGAVPAAAAAALPHITAAIARTLDSMEEL